MRVYSRPIQVPIDSATHVPARVPADSNIDSRQAELLMDVVAAMARLVKAQAARSETPAAGDVVKPN